MPRIETCRSPASADWTWARPGVIAMKSWGRSMPAAWISVAVKAWMVTGTSSIFSTRWRAVTVISSSCVSAPACAEARMPAMLAARTVSLTLRLYMGSP